MDRQTQENNMGKIDELMNETWELITKSKDVLSSVEIKRNKIENARKLLELIDYELTKFDCSRTSSSRGFLDQILFSKYIEAARRFMTVK